MSRPLLLGHRGLRLPGEPVENSIAAFDRALDLGCDGFEFDVRRTADSRAVICHDSMYSNHELAKVSYAQVEQLALLDQVLARYIGRAFLDIELKVPGLEQETLSALSRHRWKFNFVISSFFPSILREVRSLDRNAPLGFICDRESALAHWRELPADYVIPHFSLLTPDLLSDLRGSGKQVLVWTVNKGDDISRFSQWGVDGIVSDDPALLIQTVRK